MTTRVSLCMRGGRGGGTTRVSLCTRGGRGGAGGVGTGDV